MLPCNKIQKFFRYVFLLGFTPYKVEQSLQGMELQEKEEEKDGKDIGKLFRKSRKKKKMSINSGLKAI